MTDQALIIQFQNGEAKEAAFTQLLKRHRETVFFQIKKMVLDHADADDIAQAVWIKVWNKEKETNKTLTKALNTRSLYNNYYYRYISNKLEC